MRLLETGSVVGAGTSGDLCTTFAAEMVGTGFCLRGDGTGTGNAMTAVGGPVPTQTAMCPNGVDCTATSMLPLNGTSQRYESVSSFAESATPVTLCAAFSVDQVAVSTTLINHGDAGSPYSINLQQNGAMAMLNIRSATGFTQCQSATGTLLKGGHHFACATYTPGGEGTSVGRVFLDGVQLGATCTTMGGPLRPQTGLFRVGHRADGGQWFQGKIHAAFFTQKIVSDATILAMDAVVRPRLTTSIAGAVTTTRTSTQFCRGTSAGNLIRSARPCWAGSALLAEGSSTNALLRSEEFDNATWAKTQIAITANTMVAPDGTLTADTFTETTGTANHSLAQNFAQTNYTCSIYAKAGSGWASLVSTGALYYANFDLVNGVKGATFGSGTVSSMVSAGNGWWRLSFWPCSDWFNVHAGATELEATYYSRASLGRTVHLWGAQAEAASLASSYIPTAGTATTRAVTVHTVPNPLTAADTTWCIGARLAPQGWGWLTSRGVAMLGTTYNTANVAAFYLVPNGNLTLDVWNGTSALKTATSTAALTPGTAYQLAACNVAGTLSLYVNGAAVAATISGTGTGIIGTQPATMTVGSLGANYYANGSVSNLCVANRLGVCQ